MRGRGRVEEGHSRYELIGRNRSDATRRWSCNCGPSLAVEPDLVWMGRNVMTYATLAGRIRELGIEHKVIMPKGGAHGISKS